MSRASLGRRLERMLYTLSYAQCVRKELGERHSETVELKIHRSEDRAFRFTVRIDQLLRFRISKTPINRPPIMGDTDSP